jgi:acetylornithine deacetylase/succinyl-diaminopimelate desuccinylase-like protein
VPDIDAIQTVCAAVDKPVNVVMGVEGPKTMLEANAHRADEKLKIDDLVLATNVVALALHDLLSGAA